MSYNNGPRIVTNGLVLYLDAGNSKSYSGSGTTWNDLSGNSNHGTLINGPTYNAANKGGIVFDGVDDYVSITENANMQPQILTVEMGVKINSKTNSGVGANFNFQYLLFRQNTRTGNFEGYTITYGETNNNIGIGATPSSGTPQYTVNSPNDSFPLGKIALVSAVFDTNNMSLYIDGQFMGSGIKASGINYSTTHTLKLGRSVPVGATFDSHLNGNIYFTKIYNRVLSVSEILQNYNALKGRFNL